MPGESTEPSGDGPSFVPLYQQVKDILAARIAQGDWPPGMLVPAEPQLARELKVSPGTVRKALDALATARLVVRRQGRGTFVAEQTPNSSLFHFFRIVDAAGKRVMPSSEEIDRSQGQADGDEARRLAIQPGDAVLRVDRLRLLDGQPGLVERVVVPLARFPGLAEMPSPLPNTLYDLYQHQFGVTILHASERLAATGASPTSAAYLGLAEGDPVLAIDRHAYSFSDTPVEWRLSHLDCRHFGYATDLH